jgi:hypothetical protein
MRVSTISKYGDGWELVAYCGQCGLRARLDRAALIEEYGAEFPASELEAKLGCASCGLTGVSVIVRSAGEDAKPG